MSNYLILFIAWQQIAEKADNDQFLLTGQLLEIIK
jgi:hypothetical protein